ncbi:MAG TPA: hypothetical protein VIL86_09110 [Tepidisphaeraceae bacterium]|jgi:uncharacterized membrane protein
MQRFLEIILGLDKGFLSKQGDFNVTFNPHWPGQTFIGAGVWNFCLAAVALLLVIYVYRHEGRGRFARILLGTFRAALLGFILVLLNRPVITLVQSRTEPSVMAVMIDKTISMRVKDGEIGPDGQPKTRLQAVMDLLEGSDAELLRKLSKQHTIRFYSFDSNAQPLATMNQIESKEGQKPRTATATSQPAAPVAELRTLAPEGQHTQVINSVRDVLEDMQGQRIAGVVVLTDGRDTPAQPIQESLNAVKSYGVKVFPIAVGSEKAPQNIEVQLINMEESIFEGDIENAKITIRATGYEPNHPVKVVIKDKKTGLPMLKADKSPAEVTINVPNGNPIETEIQFKPDGVGPHDLIVEAVKQTGELDDQDNIRTAQVTVLDAKISVVYVDGYPRWDYRYIKNEMIREKTINISCLLTSADTGFIQEGDPATPEFPGPLKRFPDTMTELMQYDVVLVGDVDPRQFTDAQLQLVSDFVSKKGGGFGMVAGPKYAPQAYRNTAIEAVLPVNIAKVDSLENEPTITQGFRPTLTREGAASSFFRFFSDKEKNEKYLHDDLPVLFWYCRGVSAKRGVGETYAEHPSDLSPDSDGRKAPILVVGRFGAGRTLFSAVDDSWRWRFYTGESVFDTYWVQQLRYLARAKKLGQRKMTFGAVRPAYELGEQIRINMRVLDPSVQPQLPENIRVEIVDDKGTPIRQENLVRQEGQPELYVMSYAADRVGEFYARLPSIAPGMDPKEEHFSVLVPRLELMQPEVNRTLLSTLASETNGQLVEFNQARTELPKLITSAAKIIPIESAEPLWDAPLAIVIFVLLITVEWVLRKVYGML